MTDHLEKLTRKIKITKQKSDLGLQIGFKFKFPVSEVRKRRRVGMAQQHRTIRGMRRR